MAMHPGSAADFPLRRRDPLVRPTLQRLAAQKTHLFDEPLFGRLGLRETPSWFPTALAIEATLSRKPG